MRKRRQIVLSFVLVVCAIAANSASSHETNKGKTASSSDSQWIAKVGNRTVSLDDFVNRYAGYLTTNGFRDNPVVRKAILDNMINEELLLHFDEDTKLLSNQNYLNSFEWLRKQATLAYLKDQEIYAKITASDQEVRQAFARANERLAARHLYAQTEEEAENLYQLLKIGADFNYLAKQVFTDTVLQSNGGYIGYFSWGDLDPAFEDAAYALKVGEISRPVKTAHGYSILKLEDRVAHPLLTENQFLQKKAHLTRVVKIRKRRPAEREYMMRLFKPDKVVFNEVNLKLLFEQLRKASTADVESGKGRGSNAPCAKYEGKSYTQNNVFQWFTGLPQNQRERITSVEKLKAAIQGFLLQEKLLAIAHQKGYDTLPIVSEAFAKESSAFFLKRRLEELTEKADFPDSLVYDYYKTNLHLFSSEDELNVQEIIVADNHAADSLKEALRGGVDFGLLAEQRSLRTWSARNKGVMGFAPLSRFGSLKEVLWKSTVGELVGPIAIERYFGLFKVLGKKASEPLAYSAVRDRAKQMVRFEQQRKTIGDYLNTLREKVRVEINEQQLAAFKVGDVVPHE